MNLNKVVRPCGGKTQNQKFHEPKKRSPWVQVKTNKLMNQKNVMDEKWKLTIHEPTKPIGKCQKSKLTIHEPK